MKKLILASSSPFRKMLLEKLHLPFESVSPDIDETPLPGETATALVERLAIQKAQTIAKQYADALIIGSDSVAQCGSDIMSKPLTHEKAVEQLMLCSGQTVTFLTGLCLLAGENGPIQSCVEPYQVVFRKLTLPMIECYLRKEQPYQSAGSVKAESLGIALFEKLEGADFNSLMGLPLIRLVGFLEKVGYPVLS